MEEKKLGRRERKKIASRKAILAAAKQEFVRQGYKETSIADIMERADLAVGTFYKYFSSKEEILKVWESFSGEPQKLALPSAPKQFLHYFTEDNMPQTKLQRDLEGGMAVSIGRLREDTQYDYKFVCLSHNTLRGAAGGAVLLAELLCAKGYMD